MKRSLRINSVATGLRIKELRQKSGLTVMQLCETLDISQQSYYRWIRGETLPVIDHLVMLAYIFGVTVDEILVVERMEP